jgi:glycosyltransferase involved in cell wall biosynthesis
MLALRARALVRTDTRIFTTVNINLTEKLAAHRPHKRATHLIQLKRYLPRNDGIIAVSQGVAQHTATLIGLPIERIQVAPQPSVTPELEQLAVAPVEHPWFAPDQPPVILGVGRLTPQKDFASLIRAFAKLRATRPCRLVILGEGELRNALTELATSLGVADDFALPGFVTNPYAYMAKAGLFVLSSAFEGSPNVLIEALGVGAPLVATDCPYGPREILEGGRHGPLVPVGDVDALTAAMKETLDNPPNRATLTAAAQRYSTVNSASAYIHALGIDTSAAK